MMMVMMVSFASFAQNKDVTRFLGIPVDGTVASMKQKLKAKGFKQSPYNQDQLVGRFNGNNVYVNILENKANIYFPSFAVCTFHSALSCAAFHNF